jgi:S1-C subfamily serine protease/Flp pilus assembly protein TadD
MKKFILVVLIVALLAPAAAAEEISPEAAVHNMKARVALINNDNNLALEEINAAIALAPQHMLCYFLRGFIYMARKEYIPAEADFTKVIGMQPDFSGAYTQRGRALMFQNRVDQAITDFNRALSLKPDNQEALGYRAIAFFQQKKYESAQADATKAKGLGFKFSEEFLKALGQAGKDRIAPAPTPPTTPLSISPMPPKLAPTPTPEPARSPSLPAAISGAPDLVQLVKRTLPAVVTIMGFNEQGKVSSSGSGFFINGQGHLITNYHVIRSMAHAKVKTRDGKTYPMSTILAVDKYADLALCQVDIPAGSPNFLTVSREVPEVGERIIVIGSPQLLEQTVSEGIVSAIRTDTHKGQAIQMTAPISGGSSGGPVLNLKGEVVGVSTFFRVGGQNLNFAIPGHRIIALTPGPGKPLTEYYSPPRQEKAKKAYAQGKRLFEAKDYRKALEAFREAVKEDPQYASAYNYLGLTYKKLGLYDEAAQAYVKAIQLKPQNYIFLFNLGMLMYAANSPDNAVTAFKKAIEIKPEDADCHYMLGKTYVQQGNLQESMRQYHILRKLDPKLAKDLYRFMDL